MEFQRDIEIEWDTLLNLMIDARTKLMTHITQKGKNSPHLQHLFQILDAKIKELELLGGRLSGEKLQREYDQLARTGIFAEIEQL